MSEHDRTLGEELRAYRKRRGLTQAQMAKELGISRRLYVSAERPDSNPRLTTYWPMLKLLGVKFESVRECQNRTDNHHHLISWREKCARSTAALENASHKQDEHA